MVHSNTTDFSVRKSREIADTPARLDTCSHSLLTDTPEEVVMVIDFAAAQAKQLEKRMHKVRTARALAEAYKALAPYRATPEIAQAVLKLRAAAEHLGAL